MGLLDGFEKLKNEHGSAAILKERIALANDKYAAQEQKLVDSRRFQASCRLSIIFMRRFLIQHYSPVDGPLLRQVVPDSSAPPGSAANFG